MTVAVMENLELLAGAPGGVERLRSLILELAATGQLVATEGESRQLRIDEFCTVQGGIQKTPLRAPVSHHFPYLRVANVQRGRIDVASLERYELTPDELERWRLVPGDLLIVEGNGSESEIGRCAVWRGEVSDCVYQNHLMRVRPSAEACIDFLAMYLNSPVGSAHMRRLAITTSGLFNLSVGKIRSIPVRLPPLPEQHRIVAKVDELMALCDRLEARQQDAEAAHARLVQALLDSLTQARDAEEFQACWQRVAGTFELFATEDAVDRLKQAILQAGCCGKLTAAGLAAKEPSARYLAVPNEATEPFELPSGWKWICLGHLSGLVTSGSRGWKAYYADEGSTFIRSQDIKFDRLEFDQRAYVALPDGAEGSRTQVAQDDLLITITGANVGKAAHIDKPMKDAYVSQHVALVRLTDPRHAPFVHQWLVNEYGGRRLLLGSSYGAKPGLNLQNIKDLPVPLPPLAEQRRIVARVTELFALCDQLKARIAAAHAKHAQLAEALVAQAVAA